MTVKLKLICNGCFATAEGTGPLRKRFHGLNGKDYGLGQYRIDNPESLAPEGWIMFDPYTCCTYCPVCWAEIENASERQLVEQQEPSE